MHKKIALSIAGSDSGGGAGIQADLKSFQYCKVHGLSVITCVTAQNTRGIDQVFPLPLNIISAQMHSLFTDYKIDAVKIGMLFDEKIARKVIKILVQNGIKPIVDPIFQSTTKQPLAKPQLVRAIAEELIPQSLVVTANIPEATKLTGVKIVSVDDMILACKKLHQLGTRYSIVKGGHLNTNFSTDVVYDGNHIERLNLPRIIGVNVHGSGCNFSALISAFIAKGDTPLDAITKAKRVLWGFIFDHYSPGSGLAVTGYAPDFIPDLKEIDQNHISVVTDLARAVHEFIHIVPSELIPEVGTNFCYALPSARTISDVCGISGRIISSSGNVLRCGLLQFGGSKHIATIILAAMKYSEEYRSTVNLGYSPSLLNLIKDAGFSSAKFSRKDEPDSVESSMEWGTKRVVTHLGYVPDIIYDTGGPGKEAMIRVMGKNPIDVVTKVKKIIKIRDDKI